MQTVKPHRSQLLTTFQSTLTRMAKQVKGRFAEDGRYFDKDSGALATKRYLETEDGNWVYVNDKGDKLKGRTNYQWC